MIMVTLRNYAIVILSAVLIGCTASPRFTATKSPLPKAAGESGSYANVEEGLASYYGSEFNGRPTSSGEIYDMNQMTAAHRTLPFNTKIRVTSLSSGKVVLVRVNDRGPFKEDRIIDLSLAAAKELGMVGSGTSRVRLEVVEPGTSDAVKKR